MAYTDHASRDFPIYLPETKSVYLVLFPTAFGPKDRLGRRNTRDDADTQTAYPIHPSKSAIPFPPSIIALINHGPACAMFPYRILSASKKHATGASAADPSLFSPVPCNLLCSPQAHSRASSILFISRLQ